MIGPVRVADDERNGAKRVPEDVGRSHVRPAVAYHSAR
jgi:hypothetical protein